MTKTRSPRKPTVSAMRSVFRLLCEEVNSTFSLSAMHLSDKGLDNELLQLKVCADEYSNAITFGMDYAVSTFLSKWKGLSTDIDTRRVALEGWSASESGCANANVRISEFVSSTSPELMFGGKSAVSIISDAQRKIERVLGPSPVWKSVTAGCKWSGGATFGTRRGDSLTKKMTKRVDCTRDALPFIKKLIEEDPRWIEALTGHYPEGPCSLLKQNFRIVPGNRLLTVPKNAKTDRCIAAEPAGNAFLQQGVGQFIRQRLKRFGVDLDDQSWNQLLASKAHILNLATLDLSAASDSIAIQLIFLLLPIEWALYLNNIRSRETRVDGEWQHQSKFSSMGNAFTFELESLLFWALAEACLEDDGECITGVYGDDIVVPTSVASRVIETLAWAGFKTNKSKSFTHGPFFESCGKHYFLGTAVTPVYQKEFIDDSDGSNGDSISELVRLHNRLFRWSIRLRGSDHSKGFRKRLRKTLIPYFGESKVPCIPWDDVSDDGLLTDPRSFTWDRNMGFNCLCYVYVSDFRNSWNLPLLAYKLRRPQFSSSDPKGHAKESAPAGRWRYRNRYIHSSSEPSYYP